VFGSRERESPNETLEEDDFEMVDMGVAQGMQKGNAMLRQTH
jgi:hypothetical protein